MASQRIGSDAGRRSASCFLGSCGVFSTKNGVRRNSHLSLSTVGCGPSPRPRCRKTPPPKTLFRESSNPTLPFPPSHTVLAPSWNPLSPFPLQLDFVSLTGLVPVEQLENRASRHVDRPEHVSPMPWDPSPPSLPNVIFSHFSRATPYQTLGTTGSLREKNFHSLVASSLSHSAPTASHKGQPLAATRF